MRSWDSLWMSVYAILSTIYKSKEYFHKSRTKLSMMPGFLILTKNLTSTLKLKFIFVVYPCLEMVWFSEWYVYWSYTCGSNDDVFWIWSTDNWHPVVPQVGNNVQLPPLQPWGLRRSCVREQDDPTLRRVLLSLQVSQQVPRGCQHASRSVLEWHHRSYHNTGSG